MRDSSVAQMGGGLAVTAMVLVILLKKGIISLMVAVIIGSIAVVAAILWKIFAGMSDDASRRYMDDVASKNDKSNWL